MQIRVISLRSSTKRRESIQRQFSLCNKHFEFFDALTPEYAMDAIEDYDEDEFIVNCGRTATPNELACYASHLSLWQQCASGNEPIMILEDDARLLTSFSGRLDEIAGFAKRCGLLRVSIPEPAKSIYIGGTRNLELRLCEKSPLLALGYVLTPDAARQLVLSGSSVGEPVDKFLQRFWRHEQPVFIASPPIVGLTDLANESDIGGRERPNPGLRLWCRRAIRKSENSIHRFIYVARIKLAMRSQSQLWRNR